MALTDYQIQHTPSNYIIGGLTGDVIFVSGKGIRSSGNLRGTDEPNSYHDGDLPGLDFSGGRTVTFEFQVMRTQAGTEQTIDALGTVFTRVKNPKDRQLTAAGYLYNYAFNSSAVPNSCLTIKLANRATQVLLIGRPGKYDCDIDILYSYGQVKATGQWKVPDGLFYDPVVVTGSAGLASPTAGKKFPWVFPITFGSSSGSTFTLTNAGKTDGPVCFKINGPCLNPRVRNQTTGAFLQANLALGSSDTLWVDMQHGIVYLNGTVRNNALQSGSTFWDLPPGQTVIEFRSNDATAVAGQCSGYALSAWQVV